MRVLLVGKKQKEQSTARRSPKGLELETLPLARLSKMIPMLPEDTLVYLDLAGMTGPERERALRIIPRTPRILFGVIDPTGSVVDVASLFHGGAVDYIGKKLGVAGLNAKRVARIMSYVDGAAEPGEPAESAPGSVREAPAPAAISPVDGWTKVVPGKEHAFAILFVEVDDEEELKRHEAENLASAMETFRAYVERIAAPLGGRPWMWSTFGGLLLFPLTNGATSAALCGLRLLMSRIFYDVEESLLPGRTSFRLALSTGTVIYRLRNTGEIISDSLNSVFHLGKRYTKPGQFYISSDAMHLVPQKLKPLCVPSGSYEGRRIFHLIPPRPSVAEKGSESGG
ncbi:MAG TPA: hypothetical protein VMV03_02040 [Spirochaetia bacterium]|nr:hypothetical protein [Spirochaetia bacterium]